MAKRYMKKCSVSLVIQEMKIKNTIIPYSCQMAIIKKDNKWQGIGEDVEKKEHCYTFGGNVYWCTNYGKIYGSSSNI